MDAAPDPVPVVLITGQLLTAAVWAPQLAALGDRFAFHLADHGQDDSIAALARRLLADAPERFDLVAHAMGGFVAFEVLRTAPQRVRRLVLLSTFATADGPAQTERRMGYIRLVEEGRFADIVAERVPILLPPERRGDAALVDTIRQMALDTGAERFLAQQRAIMGRVDSRPALPAIACPVLIVWGRGDGICTEAQQQEMLALIPGARLAVIADSGHLMTLERPEAVNRLLADFLGAKTDNRDGTGPA